jgi:hypothetical protein
MPQQCRAQEPSPGADLKSFNQVSLGQNDTCSHGTIGLSFIFGHMFFLIVKSLELKRVALSWVPVVHTCNPSYTRGRDQEDQGSKPAQANSS